MLWYSCEDTKYDMVIRNAMLIDGSGDKGYLGALAIQGDRIVALGSDIDGRGKEEIDAQGFVLAPGFINMLSWATVSLLEDGRAMSDIKQGVTLEVMGEGWSMGPLNEEMKALDKSSQGDIKYDINWTTLGDYLHYLEHKGVSVNVASFVGATTLRIHEVGYEDRRPTPEELARMQELAKSAMEEGALGIGSSLIYAPAFYADTEELIALCEAISPYGGIYITHMRSEGNRILESIDETLQIAREADVQAEIYHLKLGGANNWDKIDAVIAKIDSARSAGLNVATNMYNYVAGATGLNASMPPWVQEGGYEAWAQRLKDPAIRARVRAEMKSDARDWENLYFGAGSADKLVLVGFKNPDLKQYTGKSLAEVALLRGTSPEDTAMDLVIEDGSRVGTVYFLMSEQNVRRQMQLPYMTFGSDAGAPAAEGKFLLSGSHPRAYGNVARLLGKYVRDEGVIPLEDAIHKLSGLAAEKLKIKQRGFLRPGYFADLVLFDPGSIIDKATFTAPHQYAEGVRHVWVNGQQVLRDGEHTGAMPGRFVKGPGYQAAH